MESKDIKLYDLAFASYLYTHTSNYDKTLNEFRKNTKNSIELENPEHRELLLKWLNSWGCRQFAKKYHQYASAKILTWYQKYYNDIIPKHKKLSDINNTDLKKINNLFDSLSSIVASKRKDLIDVHVGSTQVHQKYYLLFVL